MENMSNPYFTAIYIFIIVVHKYEENKWVWKIVSLLKCELEDPKQSPV